MSQEHWIIYDPFTGDVVAKGSGPSGSAQLQGLPDDRALLALPRAAMRQRIEDKAGLICDVLLRRAADELLAMPDLAARAPARARAAASRSRLRSAGSVKALLSAGAKDRI